MGKTKGSAVLNAVKLLRARKDDAARLVPPALRHYLEERVVVASWYPEADLIALIVTCAALLPVPRDSGFEPMGAHPPRTHLEGGDADRLHRAPTTPTPPPWTSST